MFIEVAVLTLLLPPLLVCHLAKLCERRDHDQCGSEAEPVAWCSILEIHVESLWNL
jgi:hypothetical protein